MEFIESPCKWCGEKEYDIILKEPDRLLGIDGNFQFVKCKKCGLLRQNPYLNWESLKKYYPENYSSYLPQVIDISSRIKRIDKRYGLYKRVSLINKYKPSGNWLDIGSGTGRILQEAFRWDQWHLMGIEPSIAAANYSESITDIKIHRTKIEDFDEFMDYFDIVTMWDVLEHLENPIAGLKQVFSLLKPNGVLIFSIPNLSSWDRKVFKRFWIGYDLPRHIHLFPDRLLSSILDQIGFKFIEKKCIAGSHGALMLDLQFLNIDLKSNLLKKIVEKGPDFFLPRIITFLPLWIMDQLKMSTNITYVVKKE
jgi:SAM-dependent methyltransferase